MPFKSKAQQRFMFAAEARGELKPGTAREWAHETKDIKMLPEHVADPQKTKTGFWGSPAELLALLALPAVAGLAAGATAGALTAPPGKRLSSAVGGGALGGIGGLAITMAGHQNLLPQMGQAAVGGGLAGGYVGALRRALAHAGNDADTASSHTKVAIGLHPPPPLPATPKVKRQKNRPKLPDSVLKAPKIAGEEAALEYFGIKEALDDRTIASAAAKRGVDPATLRTLVREGVGSGGPARAAITRARNTALPRTERAMAKNYVHTLMSPTPPVNHAFNALGFALER